MKLTRSFIVSSTLLIAACSASSEGPSSLSDSSGPTTMAAETAKQISIDILKSRFTEQGQGEFLTARAVEIEATGEAHTRVVQSYKGVPVYGSEVIVHLNAKGEVTDITDAAVKNIDVNTTPSISEKEAIDAAIKSVGGSSAVVGTPVADLQILHREKRGTTELAWRVQLEVSQTKKPVVFVNAHKGTVSLTFDRILPLMNREVYTANNTYSIPGTLLRKEGQVAVSDVAANDNYGLLGATYKCLKTLFNRDSYDNAGSKLVSSIHYAPLGSDSNKNAFWDSHANQMLYGDGDNVYLRNLTLGMDATAHEVTHGVTVATSNLDYYDGESGGLNESMSDIMGATCEWFRDVGGNVNTPPQPHHFYIGEDIALSAYALRSMGDPASDAVPVAMDMTSWDFYSPLKIENVDPHFSSGISNLAFYLLSQGGTHPRGKSTTEVTGIGILAAARIFYRANTIYLSPHSQFDAARVQTIRAAEDLYGVGSVQATQTRNAWAAVGVLAGPNYKPLATKTITTTGAVDLAYTFQTNGSPAIKFQIPDVLDQFGRTAQLYVRFGSAPDVWNGDFDCGPWKGGDDNICEMNPAQNGTYHVLVSAYQAVSNYKLTVGRAAELCGDGIDNNGDGKIDCADLDCRAVPACKPKTETSCFDGVDNDADGTIDCADSDCKTTAACKPETICGDGIDNNADGLTDCAAPSCATAAICANSGWTQISSSNFEASIAPYVSGGADAARVSNAAAAAGGTFSVRIRDNSGDSSSFSTATGMNLSAYSRMKIAFGYYGLGLEPGDNFIVEVLNGTTWEYAGRVVSGTAFPNSTHKTGEVFFNLNTLDNKSAVKVRFRADGSDDTDQAFIDNVVVSAK